MQQRQIDRPTNQQQKREEGKRAEDRPTASFVAADGGVLGGAAFLDRTALGQWKSQRAGGDRESPLQPHHQAGGGAERGGGIDRDFGRCEMAEDSIV